MTPKFNSEIAWRVKQEIQKKFWKSLARNECISNLLWCIRWYLVSKNFKRKKLKKNVKYPKITIITPNYNQGRFLKRCIQSVIFQNYPNLEYIVIDGKSNDNSVKMIKKYHKKLDYWVSEKDEGQADAINKGLKYATGDIFNWLNSDDYLEPNALFKCAEAYLKVPNAVGWIGGCRRVQEKKGILNVIYPNGLDRENIGQNWNGRQFYQPSCFLSTTKTKKIGGINKHLNIAFDLDLWIRILENGKFSIGRGIWSNAIIHSDAKTQKLKESMHLETIKVQKNYGFHRGAEQRFQRIFEKKKFKYICPDNLNIISQYIEKLPQRQQKENNKTYVIMFISNFLPKYDKASAHNRIKKILSILLSKGYEIHFVYCIRTDDDDKYRKSLKGNIRFVYLPRDQVKYIEMVSKIKVDFIWITNLWTTDEFYFFNKFVDDLKMNKLKVKIIADTMDFHYKKYMRKYEISKCKMDHLDAQLFLKYEKSLYNNVDCVLLVSDKEAKDLTTNIRITANTKVLPNIHEIHNGNRVSYFQSKNICYLGNFEINHNRDAVYYFLENIFNLIAQANKDIEFHILGFGSENLKSIKETKNIVIKGYIEDVELALSGYRLFVCPMNYGAGIKGKIGVAASVGVPIVTTTIGAEGFPLIDGENCFIADYPSEFADKCNHLLSDPVAWNNFSIRSKQMVRNFYGTDVISQKLMDIFSDL